jgi:N-acetylneuraminic acid mutarotase
VINIQVSCISSGAPMLLSGSLATARALQSMTVLATGQVLVTGGYDAAGVANAELYNPVTGQWRVTGSPAVARWDHSAILLANNRVLIVAGLSGAGGGTASATAELYDPAGGTWSASGSLATARYYNTATLLPNGKVLVAGGTSNGSSAISSCELYDPTLGTWSATGNLGTARAYHTATLLPNGKVLVVGGTGALPVPALSVLASAEIYNPATGTWTPVANLNGGRLNHSATLLNTGSVLVTGGSTGGGAAVATAELYNSTGNTWTSTASMTNARYFQAATLLSSGRVLVTGGATGPGPSGPGVPTTTAELYDPAAGTWSASGSLNSARMKHTQALLQDTRLLIVGGTNGTSALNSSEIYW